jgi:hypothetical protein
MKIKYSLISAALMLFACGTFFTACNSDGDDFDYNKKGLFVTGTEVNPVVTFAVEDTPSEYPVSVQATKKADSNIKLKLAIDTSLVSAYNEKNKSSYYAIPAGSVELVNPDVTIQAGGVVSNTATVRLLSTENFQDGRTYLVPVTIVSVDGDQSPIEGSKTIYLRISRTVKFAAINNNSGASSCFIFDKAEHMTNFTYQIKMYCTGWGGMHRLATWSQKDESKQSMIRWGDGNYGSDILQWVTAGPQVLSKTHFQANRWYLISLVYDGSAFRMFIDGTEDNSSVGTVPDGYLDWQRWEMGMSWGGYRSSQFFPGRFCEVRVWNKALSASQIATGLCGVDPHSEGLVAYWKFNENQGHVFHDATGHGYDMDWTNTWRDDNENGTLINHDYSSSIKWVSDDLNKCVQ